MSEVDLYSHFPQSFSVLYCSVKECSEDAPFHDPMRLVEHLEVAHQLTIENPKAVLPFLESYLRELPTDNDAGLRQRLQQSKLEEMLRIQEHERQSLYPVARVCLWCPEEYPSLPALFQHMYHDHGFNCGHLDNLVMVGEYLGILETLLSQSICIYCEGAYQNRTNLRKHLKAKGHVRINPNNHAYDRYYISNYILNNQDSVDVEENGSVDDDWDDLDIPVVEDAQCLFCELIAKDPETLWEHVMVSHGFKMDLEDDYDRIKAINYLRCCQRDVKCPLCHVEFDTAAQLTEHINNLAHSKLPVDDEWRQPQYLFPTYDDDPLLTSLF